MQLKVTKIVREYDQEIPQSQTADNPVANLKLCTTGGRGSNKEISLFLDSENCSNFRLIQHNNDYDIQVQKNLFF